MTGDVILRRDRDPWGNGAPRVEGLDVGSYRVRHSPAGPEWGYLGSGPADLALWILTDRSGDPDWADRHYQAFKDEVVAAVPRKGGRIPADRIRRWIDRRRGVARRSAVASVRSAPPGSAIAR